MDDPSPDSIIETREELMVSPSSGENPLLRDAYFLNPCMEKQVSPPPHFLPPHFAIFTETSKNMPIEVRYNGWRTPADEWKIWVEKLQPKHEYLWSKAGIHNAIIASTYEIKRDDDLILKLSKRWCSKTNTFVFPWGEATITLEDMKLCWGYSVLGDCVTNPSVNNEEKEAEEELLEARRMFNSSKAKKVPQKAWMMHFMEKEESKVEHEAFLVYWLSRFVFPAEAFDIILKSVIPIAIHLARGIRIALAPAVLATIYRDLGVLNSTINNNSTVIKNLRATIWAPFQLVQIWALERFPALKPFPYNAREHGLHRIAKWDGLKLEKNKNLKKVLDCGGVRDGFLWQPYEKNSPALEVSNEKDMWVCDNPSMDEELQSFARCLRVCELVGMGCKEKYHPHRVAMQFGMDQDIPGVVARCKKDPWMSYNRPATLIDTNWCILLSASEPDVTSRYYDWWKKCKEGHNIINGDDHCQVDELSSSSSSEAKCSDDDDVVVENGKALSHPEFGVFPPTSVGDEIVGSGCEHEAEIKSPFCDKDDASDLKGESVSTLTVDIALDLENRIQKLESVVAKIKAVRYGVRNAEENVGQLPPNGGNKPETSRVYCRRHKKGKKEAELAAEEGN